MYGSILTFIKVNNFGTRRLNGASSARNNSRPLAIFQPISAFGQPKIRFDRPNFLYVFNGDSNQ